MTVCSLNFSYAMNLQRSRFVLSGLLAPAEAVSEAFGVVNRKKKGVSTIPSLNKFDKNSTAVASPTKPGTCEGRKSEASVPYSGSTVRQQL